MDRPTFDNPVFERLYERDYFIDDAVLREILALGPEVAVPELLKIANYTLDHFRLDDPEGPEWAHCYYFLHALYLLHELHATEALEVYRRLLHQNSDYLEFWFGDYVYEELPEMLARAGQTRLPELLALLEDPTILFHQQLLVANTLARLATTHPELRPDISAFFQRYLRFIIAHADQTATLFPADTDLYAYELDTYLGMLLIELQQVDLRELEPEMRELHRLGLVDESIGGGEDDINFERLPTAPTSDIFTRYQQQRDEPDNYSPFHPDAVAIAARRAIKEANYARLRREALLRLPPQPRQVLPKIGRNDPCPCGSGQKYKKCHGA